MPGGGEIVARVHADASVETAPGLVGGTIRRRLGGVHAVVVVVEAGVAGGQHEVRSEHQAPAPPLSRGSEPPFGSARVARHVAKDLYEPMAPVETLLVAQPEIGSGSARGHSREARRDLFDGKALEAVRKESSRAPAGPEIELEPRAVGMQVGVLSFIEVQGQKIDAHAVSAIRRLLEARDHSPAGAAVLDDVREEVARRGRGRGGGCAERKSAGDEDARQAGVANNGSGSGVCEKRRGILI